MGWAGTINYGIIVNGKRITWLNVIGGKPEGKGAQDGDDTN